MVWHKDTELPADTRAVVCPGGFSYGDYLRCGSIAKYSPIMAAVRRFAEAGGPFLGVCNGFQVLCEAHLLPGALMRNESLQYRCVWVHMRVENAETPFTLACQPGQVLRVPISHGEGRYVANEETLAELESSGRVAFRYCNAEGEVTAEANPNGSMHDIAGIISERGNVLGLMPHPERACEPLMGSEDGLALWLSLLEWAKVRA